jgi:hypothetical protein
MNDAIGNEIKVGDTIAHAGNGSAGIQQYEGTRLTDKRVGVKNSRNYSWSSDEIFLQPRTVIVIQPKQQLYSWSSSELLGDYTDGLLVAMAGSADEARDKLRDEWYGQDAHMSQEWRNRTVAKLEADIECEPEVGEITHCYGGG